jgi:hypothetical protein
MTDYAEHREKVSRVPPSLPQSNCILITQNGYTQHHVAVYSVDPATGSERVIVQECSIWIGTLDNEAFGMCAPYPRSWSRDGPFRSVVLLIYQWGTRSSIPLPSGYTSAMGLPDQTEYVHPADNSYRITAAETAAGARECKGEADGQEYVYKLAESVRDLYPAVQDDYLFELEVRRPV